MTKVPILYETNEGGTLVQVSLGQTVQYHTVESIIIGAARLAAVRLGLRPFPLKKRTAIEEPKKGY